MEQRDSALNDLGAGGRGNAGAPEKGALHGPLKGPSTYHGGGGGGFIKPQLTPRGRCIHPLKTGLRLNILREWEECIATPGLFKGGGPRGT